MPVLRRLRRFLSPYLNEWSLVSLATLLYWFASQALRPYVALSLAGLGATETEVGLAVAAHPSLSIFLAIPAGRLIDVRGLRRFMLGSLGLMSVVGAGYAFATTTPQIIVLQAAAGLAETGAWVGLQALITRAGTGDFRARHLGLFSLAWGIGVAFGPSAGAIVFESLGFGALGITYSISVALAAAAVASVRFPERTSVSVESAQGASRRTVTRVLSLGRRHGVAVVLIASFVGLWANSLRTSFYPLFLEQGGISVPTIGLLMSTAGITSLLVRVPLPWILQRFPRRRTLVVGTALAAGSLAITPLIDSSVPALTIASGLFGIGFGLSTPLTVDMMADLTASEERGLAMGMRVASNRIAQVLQPMVFGLGAAAIGMPLAFGIDGLVMGGLTVWMGVSTVSGAAKAEGLRSDRPAGGNQ